MGKKGNSDKRTESYLAGRVDPFDPHGDDDADDYSPWLSGGVDEKVSVGKSLPLFGAAGATPIGVTTTTPLRPPCSGGAEGHTGLVDFAVREMDGGNRIIAGAAGRDIPDYLEPKDISLVIDLAGQYEGVSAFVQGNGLKEFDALNSFLPKPAPTVRWFWKDMSIPPRGIHYDFWVKVWDLLPAGRTVFCCFGGHGRTGTALAAMVLVANPDLSADEAIDWVRNDHCPRAIETSTQETYLESIARERDKRLGKKPKPTKK